MKRFLPLLAVAVMLCSTFFGNSIMNVMAEEPAAATIYRYYKSIEIQDGDSLWSLAQEYNTDDKLPTSSYIKELRSMNRLSGDTIHAGQHLTVLYFSTEQQ